MFLLVNLVNCGLYRPADEATAQVVNAPIQSIALQATRSTIAVSTRVLVADRITSLDHTPRNACVQGAGRCRCVVCHPDHTQ